MGRHALSAFSLVPQFMGRNILHRIQVLLKLIHICLHDESLRVSLRFAVLLLPHEIPALVHSAGN